MPKKRGSCGELWGDVEDVEDAEPNTVFVNATTDRGSLNYIQPRSVLQFLWNELTI